MPDQICEHCGTANPENESYCQACGQLLPAGRAMATQRLAVPPSPKPQLRWGTALFDERTLLQFEVKDTGEQITFELHEECVVGRAHKDVTPDLDLSPFQAMERGVSRRHAKLTRQSGTVMVQDLQSANGTFLNGMRLLPYQPRVLRNNDELVLGRLALRVSFLPAPETRSGDTGPVITPPGVPPPPIDPIEPKISPPQRGDGGRKP
ncbi:MAG: FHA domain-containing protein [Aggregatilineaceae bacterium]